jgi:hypothetical protein
LIKTDARVRTFVTEILKKDKSLIEREVKAATRTGLKLGRAPLNARVIREVRRSLGIDRPRAIAYARKLLAKNPTLQAKVVIAELAERFGVSVGPPDVTRLRPAGDRRRKALATKAESQPAKRAQRSYGSISVVYEATGMPEAVAHFFRSLAE